MSGRHAEEIDSPTIVQPLRILKAASPPPHPSDSNPYAPPPMRSIEDDFQRFRDSMSSQNSKQDTLPKHLSVQSDPEEGLFKIKPQRAEAESEPEPQPEPQPELNPAKLQRRQTDEVNPYPEHHQQHWPRSNGTTSKPPTVLAPTPRGGLSHSVSTSTTRGQRGSPPPPETPAFDVGEGPGSIEARYAASGISGTGTLSGLSASAALRAAAHPQASQPQIIPYNANRVPLLQQPRLATHRESYASTGSAEAAPQSISPSPSVIPGQVPLQNTIQIKEEHPEQLKLSNLSLEESREEDAPPAYESVAPAGTVYTDEKGKEKQQPPQTNGVGRSDSAMQAPGHPAFQRERPNRGLSVRVPSLKIATEEFSATAGYETYQNNAAAPPPLPEGWMSHFDPSSGQYYYIHLATQSTQWEFPKGHNPLNIASTSEKTSFGPPAAYGPISPTFPPGGVMSPILNSFPSNPFGALPQTTIFNIQPTNSVYFGPYLKYTNMDVERGVWIGSIMLITDAPQPPTIHIHQTVDISPNPHQLKASPIYSHQKWTFYKYDIELQMDDEGPAKWTYAITSHLGCTRYEFLVAGRYEHNWRFFAHSGNDFAINVPEVTRAQMGIDPMWRDVLQKHAEIGGFHCQLGLGNQVFCDRIWKDIPVLKEWLSINGKDNRRNAFWTPRHEEDVLHAYFHYYTSHFDQPIIREAFAQIPYIFTLNDREIFDGFGSFPEHMQASNIFKNVSRIAIDWYLLFQHHTTTEMLQNPSSNRDLFSITGSGWQFIKQLGPSVVVVGPDCRSERTSNQVMSGSTYQSLLPKIATLPATVQHCIWMIPVPLLYPRMDTVEQLANVAATGKKAVTGAYNMVGKVAGNLAGVVGAKGMVNDGFNSVKGMVGKRGLMSGMVTPFGEVDMLDSLKDLWTHESKDLERTYLIRMLQDIALQRGIRMTFLSGDVNMCGAGLFHDPLRPNDHKTMYQIISSSIINTPPPPHILKMLHNNKAPYVPINGQKSNYMPSDTKEDMMEIFQTDVTGQPREFKRLMGRRNYVAIIIFDQEELQQYHGHYAPEKSGPPQPNLSLAIDFLVQGEGMVPQPVKYGPVVIPKLEYGT